MRIITHELKKIWSVKILVIITALCALYFFAVMNSEIKNYPKDDLFLNIDFAHRLTETYGVTLSQNDFEDFLKNEEIIIFELNTFIASNSFFTGLGIFNYDDYMDFRMDYESRFDMLDDEERNLVYSLFLEWGGIVRTITGENLISDKVAPEAYAKLVSFGNIVGMYQTNIIGHDEWLSTIDSFIEYTPLNEREIQRLIEIRDSGELISIMDFHTISHTWRYARSLAVLIILVTLIMVSPLVTTDRANRVNWLQYSSKQGRGILKKQFFAVLLSAVGMTTILVLIFAGLFSVTTEVHAFWNNGINSFLSGTFHWLSITFGQYVLLMIVTMYLLSVGTAAFAFVLSQCSNNMIRLIFKVIPFFIAVFIVSNWILNDFLVIFIGGNVFLQMLSLLVTLIVGVVTAILVVCREKRVELI